MTLNNNGYQDLIINNGVISTCSNMVTSDNSALQGIQMTNQFAICANPGSTPVLVPYITPMLLSPQTTKVSMDGNNQENRSQNGHMQLANNITFPSNLFNSGNLPLGLSYINLSTLTSGAGGTAIPIQFALNTGSNQQFALPLSSITQLTNDIQIQNAFNLTPQIKFEPDVNTNDRITHIFPKTSIKTEVESSVVETILNKRSRKKVIVRKSNQFMKRQKVDDDEIEQTSTVVISESEVTYDHKGRPFTYPCNQCSKKFTQNSRLTAHLRCHSGIRPYTCTQCGFSFTQKSYLIRHAAVHKEDRPFTCAKCLKTYKHYGSLANHRKLHCRENEANLNGSQNNNQHTDDLDETIQQTIESVQMNARQNNFILTYTSNNSSTEMQSAPIVYFNQNTSSTLTRNINTLTQRSSMASLHVSGTGPVTFPGHHQELPSLAAASLLPTNRSAINELKAITTGLSTDVDECPSVSITLNNDKGSSVDFQQQQHHHQQQQHQQHIKQEPVYFNGSFQSDRPEGN